MAGLIIGVFQHGLDLATAAETYTILTVGEGLVTSIPALLVSMAGGLITTRAAAESHLGEEVAVQLLERSRPLGIAAGVLTLLAMIPGLPKLSFLTVAAILGAAAYAVRTRPAEDVTPESTHDDRRIRADGELSIRSAWTSDMRSSAWSMRRQNGTLLTRVRSIRKQIATETGLVVPPVRIADNLQLGPRAYSILVKGVEVARGELYPERLLAINPGLGHESDRRHADARSRRSVFPRHGLRRTSARRHRPPATPWLMRPPRSRRICRRPFERSCRTS